MDAQESIAQRLPGSEPAVQRMLVAATAAREARVPVVHIVIAFREGYPEVPSNTRTLVPTRARKGLLAADPTSRIHPILGPLSGETVVLKRRVGAFEGTDLDAVLRAQGVGRVVLAGLTTSGVVLTTALTAVDRDYDVTVLSDACADANGQVHDMLIDKLLPTRGSVLSVDQWIATIR